MYLFMQKYKKFKDNKINQNIEPSPVYGNIFLKPTISYKLLTFKQDLL